jgi:predicted MFS family arabinose efflux permease
MSTASDAKGLRWYQGLERYCWVVLVIAALGWLFDTMDQNLFNLVRSPSLADLLRPKVRADFRPGDFKNAGKFAAHLKEGQEPISQYLREALPARTRQQLEQYPGTGAPPAELHAGLVNALNLLVPMEGLYDPQRFSGVKLGKETQALIARNSTGTALLRRNRLLLEDAYPAEIIRVLDADVKAKGGLLTSIFLIGWSVGGFVFGILGDRIGRTGTMILTISIYALFTGLSGLVHSWEMYGAMRFMTAVGVGGEWAAGASLVAEVFPARSRPMALGMLQASSAIGNMSAALITMGLGNLEANWRVAYFVGAIPALLVLWIRRSVREPEAWKEAKEKATLGAELGNIGELFTHPILRRNTIAAVLMATAGVGALWGIGFFSTDMLRAELQSVGQAESLAWLVSLTFLLQNLGAFFGAYAFTLLAERVSRRSAFGLWFTLAWIAVLAFFWGVQGSGAGAFDRARFLAPIMGFCTLGPFAGYTVYFPELFPTRLRSTGCGFCYNAARILAAAAPFTLGSLSASMGGYAPAATVVSLVFVLGYIGLALAPETRGKPLPA